MASPATLANADKTVLVNNPDFGMQIMNTEYGNIGQTIRMAGLFHAVVISVSACSSNNDSNSDDVLDDPATTADSVGVPISVSDSTGSIDTTEVTDTTDIN